MLFYTNVVMTEIYGFPNDELYKLYNLFSAFWGIKVLKGESYDFFVRIQIGKNPVILIRYACELNQEEILFLLDKLANIMELKISVDLKSKIVFQKLVSPKILPLEVLGERLSSKGLEIAV